MLALGLLRAFAATQQYVRSLNVSDLTGDRKSLALTRSPSKATQRFTSVSVPSA